jgi:hypothetical protein
MQRGGIAVLGLTIPHLPGNTDMKDNSKCSLHVNKAIGKNNSNKSRLDR